MLLAEMLTILIMLHAVVMVKNALFELLICVICVSFMKEIFHIKFAKFNFKLTPLIYQYVAIVMYSGRVMKRILWRYLEALAVLRITFRLQLFEGMIPIDSFLVQILFWITNHNCYRIQKQVTITLLLTVWLQILYSVYVLYVTLYIKKHL